MPVKRKSAAPKKRRKKRATATPARKRKTIKRRRKKVAVGAKPRRRRKSAAKKTVRKTRRRKSVTRKKPATRRKTARRRTKKKAVSQVKKKPSKSKTSKKTSTSSRVTRSRKPIAKKKSTKIAKAQVIRAPSKKKQQQAKSDSQALPAVKQQPSIETTKMEEYKKIKKESKKQRSLPETRLELTSVNSEIDLNIAPYKERPGEDYMSSSQQAYFRRLLLQRKRVLLEDMGRTVHHLQDEGISLPDISDRATQEEEFNLELRARDRERKLIKKIEDALQQLDEGHYGFCNSCGVEIGIRRLEARPTANLCIDCKTLDEIREKQTGG